MAGVVVDACVAAKWFVAEDHATAARELLESNTELHAPDTILVEVANALWKNFRLGRIRRDAACLAIERLPKFFSELIPFETIRRPALDLARDLGHPVYDCAYAACAMELKERLITTDERLASRLATAGYQDRVTLLRDWKP